MYRARCCATAAGEEAIDGTSAANNLVHIETKVLAIEAGAQTLSLFNLAQGSQSYFRVRSGNIAGWSLFGRPLKVLTSCGEVNGVDCTTFSQTASAPPGLTSTWQTSGRFAIEWRQPEETGGAAVNHFEIVIQNSVSNAWGKHTLYWPATLNPGLNGKVVDGFKCIDNTEYTMDGKYTGDDGIWPSNWRKSHTYINAGPWGPRSIIASSANAIGPHALRPVAHVNTIIFRGPEKFRIWIDGNLEKDWSAVSSIGDARGSVVDLGMTSNRRVRVVAFELDTNGKAEKPFTGTGFGPAGLSVIMGHMATAGTKAFNLKSITVEGETMTVGHSARTEASIVIRVGDIVVFKGVNNKFADLASASGFTVEAVESTSGTDNLEYFTIRGSEHAVSIPDTKGQIGGTGQILRFAEDHPTIYSTSEQDTSGRWRCSVPNNESKSSWFSLGFDDTAWSPPSKVSLDDCQYTDGLMVNPAICVCKGQGLPAEICNDDTGLYCLTANNDNVVGWSPSTKCSKDKISYNLPRKVPSTWSVPLKVGDAGIGADTIWTKTSEGQHSDATSESRMWCRYTIEDYHNGARGELTTRNQDICGKDGLGGIGDSSPACAFDGSVHTHWSSDGVSGSSWIGFDMQRFVALCSFTIQLPDLHMVAHRKNLNTVQNLGFSPTTDIEFLGSEVVNGGKNGNLWTTLFTGKFSEESSSLGTVTFPLDTTAAFRYYRIRFTDRDAPQGRVFRVAEVRVNPAKAWTVIEGMNEGSIDLTCKTKYTGTIQGFGRASSDDLFFLNGEVDAGAFSVTTDSVPEAAEKPTWLPATEVKVGSFILNWKRPAYLGGAALKDYVITCVEIAKDGSAAGNVITYNEFTKCVGPPSAPTCSKLIDQLAADDTFNCSVVAHTGTASGTEGVIVGKSSEVRQFRTFPNGLVGEIAFETAKNDPFVEPKSNNFTFDIKILREKGSDGTAEAYLEFRTRDSGARLGDATLGPVHDLASQSGDVGRDIVVSGRVADDSVIGGLRSYSQHVQFDQNNRVLLKFADDQVILTMTMSINADNLANTPGQKEYPFETFQLGLIASGKTNSIVGDRNVTEFTILDDNDAGTITINRNCENEPRGVDDTQISECTFIEGQDSDNFLTFERIGGESGEVCAFIEVEPWSNDENGFTAHRQKINEKNVIEPCNEANFCASEDVDRYPFACDYSDPSCGAHKPSGYHACSDKRLYFNFGRREINVDEGKTGCKFPLPELRENVLTPNELYFWTPEQFSVPDPSLCRFRGCDCRLDCSRVTCGDSEKGDFNVGQYVTTEEGMIEFREGDSADEHNLLKFDDNTPETNILVRIIDDNRYEKPEKFRFRIIEADPTKHPSCRLNGANIGFTDWITVTIKDPDDELDSSPGRMRQLEVAHVTGGSLTFAWDRPDNMGGSPPPNVKRYVLERCNVEDNPTRHTNRCEPPGDETVKGGFSCPDVVHFMECDAEEGRWEMLYDGPGIPRNFDGVTGKMLEEGATVDNMVVRSTFEWNTGLVKETFYVFRIRAANAADETDYMNRRNLHNNLCYNWSPYLRVSTSAATAPGPSRARASAITKYIDSDGNYHATNADCLCPDCAWQYPTRCSPAEMAAQGKSCSKLSSYCGRKIQLHKGTINLNHANYGKSLSGGSLTLAWEDPINTGGIPITGYKVYVIRNKDGANDGLKTEHSVGMSDVKINNDCDDDRCGWLDDTKTRCRCPLWEGREKKIKLTCYRRSEVQETVYQSNIESLSFDDACTTETIVKRDDSQQKDEVGESLKVRNYYKCLKGFAKASEYSFEVQARNAVSYGSFSEITVLSTNPSASKPGRAPIPELSSATGGSILLNFKAPEDTGGVRYQDLQYLLQIQHKVMDSDDGSMKWTGNWESLDVLPRRGHYAAEKYGQWACERCYSQQRVTSYKNKPEQARLDSYLVASTAYRFRVAAYSSEIGEYSCGSYDFPQFKTVAMTPPEPTWGDTAPRRVDGGTTGGMIKVKMIPPYDQGGGKVTGYITQFDRAKKDIDNIEIHPIEWENHWSVEHDGRDNTIDVVEIGRYNGNHLDYKTTYRFRTVALNQISTCLQITSSAGEGDAHDFDAYDYGESGQEKTADEPTDPSPPRAFGLAVSDQIYPHKTGGALFPMWTDPLDTGGLDIDRYVLARDSIEIFNGRHRKFEDKGLLAKTAYTYTVRAETEWTTAPTGKTKLRVGQTATKRLTSGSLSAPRSEEMRCKPWVVGKPSAGSIEIAYLPPRDHGGVANVGSLSNYRGDYFYREALKEHLEYSVMMASSLDPLSPGLSDYNTNDPHMATTNINLDNAEWQRVLDERAKAWNFKEVYRGPSTGFIHFRLQPDATYAFRVATLGTKGSTIRKGSYSSVLVQSTAPSPTPPRPVGPLKVLRSTSGVFDIEWDMPLDTGGLTIKGFDVYWETDVQSSDDVTSWPKARRGTTTPPIKSTLLRSCRLPSSTGEKPYFHPLEIKRKGDKDNFFQAATKEFVEGDEKWHKSFCIVSHKTETNPNRFNDIWTVEGLEHADYGAIGYLGTINKVKDSLKSLTVDEGKRVLAFEILDGVVERNPLVIDGEQQTAMNGFFPKLTSTYPEFFDWEVNYRGIDEKGIPVKMPRTGKTNNVVDADKVVALVEGGATACQNYVDAEEMKGKRLVTGDSMSNFGEGYVTSLKWTKGGPRPEPLESWTDKLKLHVSRLSDEFGNCLYVDKDATYRFYVVPKGVIDRSKFTSNNVDPDNSPTEGASADTSGVPGDAGSSARVVYIRASMDRKDITCHDERFSNTALDQTRSDHIFPSSEHNINWGKMPQNPDLEDPKWMKDTNTWMGDKDAQHRWIGPGWTPPSENKETPESWYTPNTKTQPIITDCFVSHGGGHLEAPSVLTAPSPPRFLRALGRASGGAVNLTWAEPDDMGGALKIHEFVLFVDGVECYRGLAKTFEYTGMVPGNKEYEFEAQACIGNSNTNTLCSSKSPVVKVQSDYITRPGMLREPWQISATKASMLIGWTTISQYVHITCAEPGKDDSVSVSSKAGADKEAGACVEGRRYVDLGFDSGGSEILGYDLHVRELRRADCDDSNPLISCNHPEYIDDEMYPRDADGKRTIGTFDQIISFDRADVKECELKDRFDPIARNDAVFPPHLKESHVLCTKVIGLGAARFYKLQVRARNKAGTGPWSAMDVDVPSGTEASTPQNVQILQATDKGIRLSFEFPEREDGVRVEFFNVYAECDSWYPTEQDRLKQRNGFKRDQLGNDDYVPELGRLVGTARVSPLDPKNFAEYTPVLEDSVNQAYRERFNVFNPANRTREVFASNGNNMVDDMYVLVCNGVSCPGRKCKIRVTATNTTCMSGFAATKGLGPEYDDSPLACVEKCPIGGRCNVLQGLSPSGNTETCRERDANGFITVTSCKMTQWIGRGSPTPPTKEVSLPLADGSPWNVALTGEMEFLSNKGEFVVTPDCDAGTDGCLLARHDTRKWSKAKDEVELPILTSLSRGVYGIPMIWKYSNNMNYMWSINMGRESWIYTEVLLNFEYFDLECDHDYVEVRWAGPPDSESPNHMWRGGCKRESFTMSFRLSKSGTERVPITIRLRTDRNFIRSGMRVTYEATTNMVSDARAITTMRWVKESAPMGPVDGISGLRKECSGRSAVPPSKGKCKCKAGFAAEDCSALEFSDSHEVCGDRDAKINVCRYVREGMGGCVIAVAPYGDDAGGTIAAEETGTGVLGDTTLISYSAPDDSFLAQSMKAFKTLRKALEIATSDIADSAEKQYMRQCVAKGYDPIVLVYPGLGSSIEPYTDCNLEVSASPLDLRMRKEDSRVARNIAVVSVNGYRDTVLDCTHANSELNDGRSKRGIQVKGDSLHESSFLLRGFTIRGGQSARGGAMSVKRQATVILDSCLIEKNTATAEGGGIHVSDSRLIMIKSHIRENVCEGECAGGGIYVKGYNYCRNDQKKCSLTGQSCQNTPCPRTDGATYTSGTHTITKPPLFTISLDEVSSVVENVAEVGGGVFIDGASMRGGIIRANIAHSDGANLALVDTKFNDPSNEKAHGSIPKIGMKGTRVSVKDMHIIDGKAGGHGGGIFVGCGHPTFEIGQVESRGEDESPTECGPMKMTRLELRNNTATIGGGGIFMYDAGGNTGVVVNRKEVEEYSAPVEYGKRRGLVLNSNNVSIIECKAPKGAGLSMAGRVSIFASKTRVNDNIASQSGGGIYVNSGNALIQGSGEYDQFEVRGNAVEATDVHGNGGMGGGIHVSNAELTFSDITVAKNRADLGGGLSFTCNQSPFARRYGFVCPRSNGDLYRRIDVCVNEQRCGAKAVFKGRAPVVHHNSANECGGNLYATPATSISLPSGIEEANYKLRENIAWVMLERLAVTNGRAPRGAGVCLESTSVASETQNANVIISARLRSVEVADNIASESGGGIWHGGSVLILAGSGVGEPVKLPVTTGRAKSASSYCEGYGDGYEQDVFGNLVPILRGARQVACSKGIIGEYGDTASTTIHHNSAGYMGGAIYVKGDKVNAKSVYRSVLAFGVVDASKGISHIFENTAGDIGGGISFENAGGVIAVMGAGIFVFFFTGPLELVNTHVRRNLARGQSPAAIGGGIYLQNAHINLVTNSKCISGKDCAEAQSWEREGFPIVKGRTVIQENVAARGGGIAIASDSMLDVDEVENRNPYFGFPSEKYYYQIDTDDFASISYHGTASSARGALKSDVDSSIEYNAAYEVQRIGGGINDAYDVISQQQNLKNKMAGESNDDLAWGNELTVLNKDAQGYGGNLLITSGSKAEISPVRIIGGMAGKGGGVAFMSGASVFCLGLLLELNAAAEGGGFYVGENTLVQLNGSVVVDNIAGRMGGGAGFFENADFGIASSLITRNQAMAPDQMASGGAFNVEFGSLRLENVILEANVAGPGVSNNAGGVGPVNSRLGGALYLIGVDFMCSQCLFRKNEASSGGAMYVKGIESGMTNNVARVHLAMTTFQNNLAGNPGSFSSRGGACVYESISVVHAIPSQKGNFLIDLSRVVQKGLNVLETQSIEAKESEDNFISTADTRTNGVLDSIGEGFISDGVVYKENRADEGGAFAAVGVGTRINPDKYLAGIPPAIAVGNRASRSGGAAFITCKSGQRPLERLAAPMLEDTLLFMDKLSIHDCSANVTGGGAIYVQGMESGTSNSSSPSSNDVEVCRVVVRDTSMTNNFVIAPGANGGAIGVAGNARVDIISSMIRDNEAMEGSGAGISVEGSGAKMNIENSTLLHNIAGISGGGVYLGSQSIAILARVKIDGNVAVNGDGGGIMSMGAKNLTVVDSLLTSNVATIGYGGGICLTSTASAVLVSMATSMLPWTIFSQKNEAQLHVLHSQGLGCQACTRTEMHNNSAPQSSGGALYARSSVLRVHGCDGYDNSVVFTANKAQVGGGVFTTGGSDVELTSAWIEDNGAQYDGGALGVQQSKLRMRKSRLTRNKATSRGGGIYLDRLAETEIDNCILQSNWVDGNGGGIFIGLRANLDLRGSTIELNKAQGDGAGLFVVDTGIQIVKTKFEKNGLETGTGAGLCASGAAAVICRQCSFFGNAVMQSGRGGGMALTGASSMLLLSSTINSNRADMGGGIFLKDTSEIRIGVESVGGDYYTVMENEQLSSDPTVFSGNLAGLSVDEFESGGRQNDEEDSSSSSDLDVTNAASNYGRGGALHASQHSRIQMTDAKVINNLALASGGGIFVGDTSHLELDRSTFEGNSALLMGGAIHTSHMVCPETSDENVQGIPDISELDGDVSLVSSNTTDNLTSIETQEGKPEDYVPEPVDQCDAWRQATCLSQCKNMGILKQYECRKNCYGPPPAPPESIITDADGSRIHVGVQSKVPKRSNSGDLLGNRLTEQARSMTCRRIADVYAECSTQDFNGSPAQASAAIKQREAEAAQSDEGLGPTWGSSSSSVPSKHLDFFKLTTSINSLPIAPHIMALDYYSKPALLETSMECTVYENTAGLSQDTTGMSPKEQEDAREREKKEKSGTASNAALATEVPELAAELENFHRSAEQGIVDFGSLRIKGTIGYRYPLAARCDIPGTSIIEVSLDIGPCDPGEALIASTKQCKFCPTGTYSTSGRSCLECPLGADCFRTVRTVAEKDLSDPLAITTVSDSADVTVYVTSEVGVDWPTPKPGFWVSFAPRDIIDVLPDGASAAINGAKEGGETNEEFWNRVPKPPEMKRVSLDSLVSQMTGEEQDERAAEVARTLKRQLVETTADDNSNITDTTKVDEAAAMARNPNSIRHRSPSGRLPPSGATGYCDWDQGYCMPGEMIDPEEGCVPVKNRDPDRIFACIEGMQFYQCPLREHACGAPEASTVTFLEDGSQLLDSARTFGRKNESSVEFVPRLSAGAVVGITGITDGKGTKDYGRRRHLANVSTTRSGETTETFAAFGSSNCKE
eukprot:g1914.t1